MAIEHKIAKWMDDATCGTCSQSWEGECRAFQLAHSEAEQEHRSEGDAICLRDRIVRYPQEDTDGR